MKVLDMPKNGFLLSGKDLEILDSYMVLDTIWHWFDAHHSKRCLLFVL